VKNQSVPDPSQIPPRPIAVLDLDGVLADVRHRLHHLERQPKNWAAFFAAAARDPLLPEGAAVAAQLVADHEIVYLTGRPERCRPDTLDWLGRHGLPEGELIMRSNNDRRPAAQVKVGHLRTLRKRATLAVLIDDDPEVITAAISAGVPTLLADWVVRTEALARAQNEEGRA
jgi:phosphoglycolate phosphatase-like HAD superfamily hydrolase